MYNIYVYTSMNNWTTMHIEISPFIFKNLFKMEAKRRKVGDVYPARGNRFQDKVEP